MHSVEIAHTIECRVCSKRAAQLKLPGLAPPMKIFEVIAYKI